MDRVAPFYLEGLPRFDLDGLQWSGLETLILG